MGGSPSERFRGKAKGIAEEMKARWNLDRQEVIGASPVEGPAGALTEHGAFGNWSSSDETGVPRSRATKAPAPPPPCQVLSGAGL